MLKPLSDVYIQCDNDTHSSICIIFSFSLQKDFINKIETYLKTYGIDIFDVRHNQFNVKNNPNYNILDISDCLESYFIDNYGFIVRKNIKF